MIDVFLSSVAEHDNIVQINQSGAPPVTRCGISIRVLRLLRILTDLNELRINVGHVWALEHCARTVILASTDYTFTTPD